MNENLIAEISINEKTNQKFEKEAIFFHSFGHKRSDDIQSKIEEIQANLHRNIQSIDLKLKKISEDILISNSTTRDSIIG